MGYLQLRQLFRSLLRSTLFVATLPLFVILMSLPGMTPNAEAAGLTGFRDTSGASTGQTTSITINRPLSTLNGDVMIAAITILSPGGVMTVIPPAGWTQIRQDLVPGEIAQVLFYKLSTGVGEPASYTFTHNQSNEASGAISSYWGIDTAAPIHAHNGQFNSGATSVAPEVVTTVPGTTLIAIFGTKDGTTLSPPTAATALPVDMVERWQQTGTNGIQGFDELFNSSGGTGTRTTTAGVPAVGQLLALNPAPATASGTVLFPTRNLGYLTAGEQVRVDLLTSWGYTVRQIYAGATPVEITPELAASDAVYISEEVQSNDIGSNYTASCAGVVNEETALVDDLLMANSTTGASNWTDINIGNTTHYITQDFLLGPMTVFASVDNNQLQYLTGIAGGSTNLAYYPGGTVADITLAAYEIGSNMTDNSSAAGRRVALPWGASQMDVDEILNLTANGQQILRRSIEWAMAVNHCYSLTKRAFLTDGTPITDGSSLPVGTKIHFLIYFDNTHATAINNLNISDTLDPTFLYTPIASGGILKVDNSANTGASESAIYTAVNNATNLTEDLVDGSLVAGYTPGTTTISAGSDTGNATLNIAASKVWAMLFEVTLQP